MNVNLNENSVNGYCGNCEQTSTFEFNTGGNRLNHLSIALDDPFQPFSSKIYQFCKCVNCGAGGLAFGHGRDSRIIALKDFFPTSYNFYPIPKDVPKGIGEEFREAERCSGIQAWRAGAAMLRSTLEKTLRDHGYTEWALSENLKNVGDDGVIPIPLREKAKTIVKFLGDNVMHKEWRAVTEDEFEEAHHYTQRILEAFYDDTEEVKKVIKNAGRAIAEPELKTREENADSTNEEAEEVKLEEQLVSEPA